MKSYFDLLNDKDVYNDLNIHKYICTYIYTYIKELIKIYRDFEK